MKRITNFTIAIPTLDRPKALARCLDAVLNGTVLPAEVLIIDQGQYDVAEQVISQARLNCPIPLIHCSQPQKGLSAARNLASGQTHGQIIAFTDDDCVPASDWLAQIERTMTSLPACDGVTGSILPFGEETSGLFPISIRTSRKRTTFQGRALPWHVGSGGNFAIKRDWLLRIGGYDERLGAGSPGKAAEDTDIFYRLLQVGAIICYEPQAVVYHERQDVIRLTRSFWNYSHGIGAFTAKHFRTGDLFAAYILGVWLFWLVWRTASSIPRRNRIFAGEGLLSLKGCCHGLAYGFRLR
jgi:glycosyltransferase involved in cell wall biosynthesis